MTALAFSLAGFAALFAAIWILHRPLDVHSAPSRAVRNVHRVLEWTMTVWGLALLVQIACLFAPPCKKNCSETKGIPAMGTTAALFRIAEIEVKPEYLDAYLAAAATVGATSVREEPGVLCIYPMQDAEKPTSIRILEIYAGEAAYQAHLATPHVRAYKEGTPHMIDSLRLAPMRPLDSTLFPDVFRKTAPRATGE